jgi:hypothetical protein
MSILTRLLSSLRMALNFMILAAVLGSSGQLPVDLPGRVRAFTRPLEFDYATWTIQALAVKMEQEALSISDYLGGAARNQAVLDYLDLVANIQRSETRLHEIFADPAIDNPQQASEALRAELETLYDQRMKSGPLAESILQSQLSDVIHEMGLSLAGQPIPPVLYHSTPLPQALIISPRNVIRQEADISLLPDLTVDQQQALEEQVDNALDISSLVVSIGGVGLYPTMVYQTSYLNGLLEVVAHEWVHNYLTLRPLGVNYFASAGLRTMNETVASIAGKEIGLALLERYYPEFVPPSPANTEANPPADEQPAEPATLPVFDFQTEMRVTRQNVDRMLEAGQVLEAEAYMENRRAVFWENGYRIRKLNQAYFAFHGAYADHPSGGAAGEDPVGAAVRDLRSASPTLAQFINHMSWMWSVDQLYKTVSQP